MATEKTTLQVEVRTSGVNTATRQMNSFSSAGNKASSAALNVGKAATTTGNKILDGIGNSVNKVSGFLNGNGSSALSKFAGRLGELGKQIGGVKALLIAMIALKIAQFLYRAAEAAAAFGGQLANIATLLPGQISKVQEYGNSINSLSIELAKSQSDLAGATYQVVSAFGDQANTMDTVEIAARAATAGLASTSDAVNLLSSVSKGYNDTSTETLQKISDLAFTTVRLGQTTFPELASSMGQVVPIAESLGIKMEELFGVAATLTGVTGNTSEVMTQQRAAMVALLRPLPELEKLYTKLGVASGEEFIAQQGGFVEALQRIKQESESSGISITDYVGRVEGITATLALAGAQSDNYVQKLEEIRNATGATDAALSEVTDGINRYGFGLNQFKQRLANLREAFGQLALVFTADLNRAPGKLITLLDQVVRSITSYVRAIETFTRPIRALFSGVFGIVFDLVRGPLKLLQGAFDWLSNFMNAVFSRAVEVITERIRTFWNSLTGVQAVIANVTEWFKNLKGVLDPTALGIALVDATVKGLSIAILGLAVGLQAVIVQIQNAMITLSAFGEIITAVANKDFGAIIDISKEAFGDIGDNLVDFGKETKLAFGLMSSDFETQTNEMVEQARESFELIALYMGQSFDFEKEYDSTAITDQFDAAITHIQKRSGIIGDAFDQQAERVKAFGTAIESLLNDPNVENYTINKFIEDNIELFELWKGGAEEVVRVMERLGNKSSESIDKTNRAVQNTTTSFGSFEAMLASVYSQLFKTLGLSDELSDSWGALAASFTMQGFDNALAGIKELGQAFADGAVSAEEFSKVIANQFQLILDALPTLFLQAGLQAIVLGNLPLGLALIGAAATSSFVSGLTSGLQEQNASGNVYSNGSRVDRYANGGVASAPTYFPTNNGIGVFGEQGDEAILPLARTSNGDLGVQATGGSGETTVNVYTLPGESATVQETNTPDGKVLDIYITNKTREDISTGRMDDLLASRYGLRLQGVN